MKNCSCWHKQKGRKLETKSSKHSIYQSYPEILQEFSSIVNSSLSNDIIDGFEHCNGAEVAEKDVPPEVNIIGKKKYFLNATKHLAEKLKDTSDHDFILVELDNMNEVVLLPDSINFGSPKEPKHYKM